MNRIAEPPFRLTESSSRNSLLLDMMPVVLYTSGPAPDFKVAWITENVEHLTGYSSRQFVDIPDLWISRIHPDDSGRVLSAIEHPPSTHSYALEYRWRCADGQYRWFLDTINYIVDDRDSSVELIGCWFDITVRKSYEESMRTLSSIVESSDDAIIGFSLQGAIESWNASAERIYGYSAKEIIGRQILEVIPPAQQSEFEAIIGSIKRGVGLRHMESMHRTRRGEIINVAFTVSPLRNVADKITGASMIVRDTTEHKRLQEELIRTSHRYTEDLQHLTRTMQHAQEEERRRISRELHDDLNQRLSSLKLGVEVLAGRIPADSRNLAMSLKEYAQQLDEMIRDVRAIASGLRPAILDDFGLLVSLKLLCREFEHLHHCKTTFSTCECMPDRFDANVQIAFYRVAQETLSNIAKHSSATRCTLRLACDTSSFTMTIEDNGKGFDLNELVSREISRRGLGLTGMRERMEMIGGKFQVDSEQEKGTRITAHIPRTSCTKST